MIDSVVFGFGFRMRSGKDTAVAEIITKRGLILDEGIIFPVWGEDGALEGHVDQDGHERYDIRRYAFADALKREVNEAAVKAGGMEKVFDTMSFPGWVKYDPNAPMDDPLCPFGKQRTLLQFWGAEYRRAQDSDYWVKQLANTVELEKPQIALISDMRFPNEMAFVKQCGETIRVDRNGLPPATHASETALADTSNEDWSIILENNGTLEEFKEGAVTCFDELLMNFPSKL